MRKLISICLILGSFSISNFCWAETQLKIDNSIFDVDRWRDPPKYQGSLSAVVNLASLQSCLHDEVNPGSCQDKAEELAVERLEELLARFRCSYSDPNKRPNPKIEYYPLVTYPSQEKATLLYATQNVSCLINPSAQPHMIKAGLFSNLLCADSTVKCDFSWVDLSSAPSQVYLHNTVDQVRENLLDTWQDANRETIRNLRP